MDDINTDIDSYSIIDILSILNIIYPTTTNVSQRADDLISRYLPTGANPNPVLVTFFTAAKDKVMDYLNNMDDPVEPEYLTERTESIQQTWENSGYKDQSIDATRIFTDRSHVVYKPEDTINKPDVTPVISTHIVNIDSQYRTNILPYSENPLSNSYNTNFTFNLTNPITKAISAKLYSYQIPTSWYAFNARSGNTFFMYNGIIITIPDGNYTVQSLVAELNAIAAQNIATSDLVVSFNPVDNRISFKNNNLLSDTITVVFFIQGNVINYNNCGSTSLTQFQTLGINSTLGWLMGFHLTANSTTGDVSITLAPGETIKGNVAPDTYGPKYFILSLEDYSNQRLSSGLYNITNTTNIATISIPDFYKTTAVACKLREGQLTQSQLYTINAVTESSKPNNTATGFNSKLSGPSSGSAFAIIPLQDITNLRPTPYVKFGADLAVHKRNYLSPTYLDRFTVRLTDDKGNLVDLHDNDWSFSMIVEERLN